MGFKDFWLNNNGKKEQLNDIKHGVRKEQVDKKFHNLFDAYDTNRDGTLENEELTGIFNGLSSFAGEDKVLDSKENTLAKSVFSEKAKMEDVDFMGFVKSVSDSFANVISSEEKVNSNGEKEIKTKYKDGVTETIVYYADGGFKYKKIDKKFSETIYEIEINGRKKQINKEQFDKALKEIDRRAKEAKTPKTPTRGLEGQVWINIQQPQDNIKASSTTNTREEHESEYSARYILENLGVDLNSEEGKKIHERMQYLPKEAFDQIKDGKDLKELISENELELTFDNLSNVLELTYGVTLRDEEEFKAAEPQREKLITQIKIATVLTQLFEAMGQWNDNYTDSLGLFGLGSEAIGWALEKLGAGKNHYQWATWCHECAERCSKLKVLNFKQFEKDFKNIKGEYYDEYAVDFDVNSMKEIVKLAEEGKAIKEDGTNFTDEYKALIEKNFKLVIDNPNDSTYNQLMNSFGEALIMIMTLGWGAEAKGGQMLASSTIGTFSRLGAGVAAKQVNNKLLQGVLRFSGKTIKLIGPALNEGTKMATYTLVTGTASNVANRAIKFDQEDTIDKFLQTEAMVVEGSEGSFVFGAFAGVFGSTVTQKVVQSASRVSSKVVTSLTDKFAKGAVDASEVYATILEKSMPTAAAEVAAFCTDVVGFTAFESALAIVKNLGSEELTPENITKLLWKEFKSQGYNLGQIKLVSLAMMWMNGSRSARIQSMNYMKDNIPQLKGAKIEQKGDSFKINLTDGRKIECKNANEMIASLHLMVRNETAFSSKFDVKNKNITASEIDIELPNATTYADAVEKLKSASSSREITTPNGEKVIIYHRNALNLGDYTFARFNQKGTLVEQGTISSNKFAEKFGVGLNESTKLSSSGMLMMSLDMGIIESLVRTIKLNYDHQKFNNAESALDKLAIMYGYDLSDKEQNRIFQVKLRTIKFEESDTPEQRAAKIDAMFKPLNVNEIAADISNNLSYSKMAEKYGVSVGRIRKFMEENNLSTKDGSIIKTITKEDLERYIAEGKSAKEIAEIYGLSSVGALTPLYSKFKIEPPTTSKVEALTIDRYFEYKKKGMSDKEIADELNVAPQYITEFKRNNDITFDDTKDVREYPIETIGEMLKTKSPKEVSEELDISFAKIQEIIKENNFEILPENPRQELELSRKTIKNLLEQYKDDLYDYNLEFLNKLKITSKNAELITKILQRSDLRKSKYLKYVIERLELDDNHKSTKYDISDSIYEDAVRIIDSIPENNPIGISGEGIIELIRNSRIKGNADRAIELYKQITSNTKSIEIVKKNGFQDLFESNITPEDIAKIKNDENLSQHIELLMYNSATRGEYSSILETLSKRPELLQNEKVQQILRTYESKDNNNLYLILNLEHIEDIETVAKYVDYTFLSELPTRQKLQAVEMFLPEVLRLENILKNRNFMENFDKLMDTMTPKNVEYKLRVLEEINKSETLSKVDIADIVSKVKNEKTCNEALETLSALKAEPPKVEEVKVENVEPDTKTERTSEDTAREILSTLNTARELVDKDGNKVIIFHRNWLNAGDWSYLRFDKEGKQIGSIETIAESDFEKVFGEGNNINKSSKLNKSGTLMMSLDFGILESLARTLTANYDLYKFNKNYSAQRSDLTWKSFDEIVKLGKSKSKITKDSSLESFQKNVQNLEEQIRKRYSGKVDQYRRNAVIERAEKIREDYYMKEYGHTPEKLPYLSDVQIIYLENVLRNNYYSEANSDILIAVNNVLEVKSPLSAYVVETLLPHTSKWREYNLYPKEIVPQIDNVEQALVLSKVLQNPPSELYSFSTKYVFECKTPSQLYLCNKALDLSSEYNCCYDYINLIKNVKTKEEYEIVKNILSEKEYAEKQSWYLRDIIKVANKNQELQQLFLKFTSIPEVLKNDRILTFIRNNFGENYPKTEYLPLLNYVFSNEKLYKNKNIVENLSVYAWQTNTPEKTQKLIYILEYIASHKELSDTRKKVQVVTEALRFTKTKDEIDPKIKVLDFCLSNEKIKKTNFLENAELLLSEIKTNKEADETIKLMLKIMSDTKNEDIVEYLLLLVSFPEEYNKDLDSLIYMTDKIISDNNFKTYKEQGVNVNALLGHTLVNAPTTKDKNVMDAYMQTVKIFLTKKSLAENPNLLGSLNGDNKKQIIDLIKNGNRYSIPDNKLPAIIGSIDHYDYHDYQSILKTYGYGKISTFSDEEFKAVLLLNGLYRKSNINEIPMYEKKKILRNMVHLNSQLFSLSSDVLKDYPLMPKSAEEYCDILPAMVRSLGIQTNYIRSEEISKFNSSLSQLSQVMSVISDETFADLTIKQDYPKDKFIKDVLAKVKDLSRSERQKVYDYFGFELHHNPNNETGFSITGYPVNLNNGQKLAQISEPNTRAIIESLRPDVIKFSTRNRIRSNNPQVEQFLNDIVEVLPEIRTAIGKNQHKTQKFDIMQHSLKVFKKLSQDSNFKKLNDSDKKIMLLASLLHDITKGEGFTDNTHAYDSSFDAYYIAKKLRLTEDESSKLYTLIKHHEWLEFVNTARRKDGSVDNELLKKRLQSVAYDLQYDNLFDMALMFTHADLRSVKIDDSFHDSTVGGKGRTSASGKPRSYGDIAEDCAKAIRSYIKELKASQPLLPHTTMPKSSKVARAITKVHSDGSTNLRGVYVDSKDNLIIIKFNEATDKTWEALGMPKGTSSQAAKAKVKTKHSENEVDVGNINFIVHGLDYENQLVNFDSFALKDSEALLSVSYTERPRDKYRFFRTQGVTLKTQTKYIHGGGARDSGSGYKKTIADFKNRFLFGGEREDERLFLSQLIKEATGMSDKEYIEFVEKNANKSMYEIEPAKIRDKIIKAYASINSNVRRGDRSYNECYVSNAEASAPFVYPEKGSVVGNPVEFLNSDKVASKTEFLRKYAHDNDEVFIVFGD